MGNTVSSRRRIDRAAKVSLLLALAVALFGFWLQQAEHALFLGGLLLAFGEAALVGGLADWFAVRALFGHPLGIPFPHSALIPRNRKRIVSELRGLVEKEWLPLSLLQARVAALDFVGDLLLPFIRSQHGTLEGVLRTATKNVLDDVSPPRLAGFLARAAGHALDMEKLAPLAHAARRAREDDWLAPIVKELLARMVAWAGSHESRAVIRRHLESAATRYRDKNWFSSLTFNVAELFGGLDLDGAASIIQGEMGRFAAAQGEPDSALRRTISEGLERVEQKLLDDPQFISGLRAFLIENADEGSLPAILGPIVAAVHAEARRELDRSASPFVGWVIDRLERWLKEVENNPETRDKVNAWCRQLASTLIERHHGVIGKLVEEQLTRLSDENLTELIESKVGEDLNWIRLNGTFVGGVIGVVLYLLLCLLR